MSYIWIYGYVLVFLARHGLVGNLVIWKQWECSSHTELLRKCTSSEKQNHGSKIDIIDLAT